MAIVPSLIPSFILFVFANTAFCSYLTVVIQAIKSSLALVTSGKCTSNNFYDFSNIIALCLITNGMMFDPYTGLYLVIFFWYDYSNTVSVEYTTSKIQSLPSMRNSISGRPPPSFKLPKHLHTGLGLLFASINSTTLSTTC